MKKTKTSKYNNENKKIGTIKRIEETSHSKYELELIIKNAENEISTDNEENKLRLFFTLSKCKSSISLIPKLGAYAIFLLLSFSNSR